MKRVSDLVSKDCIYLGQQSMEIARLILAPAGGISRPGEWRMGRVCFPSWADGFCVWKKGRPIETAVFRNFDD